MSGTGKEPVSAGPVADEDVVHFEWSDSPKFWSTDDTEWVRAETCPSCQVEGSVLPIAYGYPTREFDFERFAIGGCVVYEGQPEVSCRECEWYGHLCDLPGCPPDISVESQRAKAAFLADGELAHEAAARDVQPLRFVQDNPPHVNMPLADALEALELPANADVQAAWLAATRLESEAGHRDFAPGERNVYINRVRAALENVRYYLR